MIDSDCPRCGDDLRDHLCAFKCPECGTVAHEWDLTRSHTADCPRMPPLIEPRDHDAERFNHVPQGRSR